MTDKTIILIDGENLLLRYEAMVAGGKTPKSSVTYSPGRYTWAPEITETYKFNLARVSYYTTFVGDNDAIEQLNNEIASQEYEYQSSAYHGVGTLNPHVYKKEKQSAKTKSVDINLSIDALRHAYKGNIDKLIIISGDGDYLPLVQEVMRQGISVSICALSEGCHPALIYVPDDFHDIDEYFFEK